MAKGQKDPLGLEKIEGIVHIPDMGLYAKTRKASRQLKRILRKNGYVLEDQLKSKTEYSRDYHLKHRMMRWWITLGENVLQSKIKCNSCGDYIEKNAMVHGNKCEACGDYTYLKFDHGTHIRFYFIGDDAWLPSLRMEIYDYDKDMGCLLVYPIPVDGNGFNDFKVERALDHLESSKDKYTTVIRRGKIYLAIPYDPYRGKLGIERVIDPMDFTPEFHNYRVIKLFMGKEFKEYDDLPLPENLSIYDTWDWPLLEPSPTLHEAIISAAGMVSRVDFYYQDGRREFYDIHMERMRLFVEHFTTIDLTSWDEFIKYADKSGPGMIRNLANAISDKPQIKNEPNMGNFLVGMGLIIEGKNMTADETTAFKDSFQDPTTQELVQSWTHK